MVTADFCRGGCICGTALNAKDVDLSTVMTNFRKIRSTSFHFLESCISTAEYYDRFTERFRDLDFKDFERALSDRYRQPYIVPEDAIQDIFETMHKNTEAKKNVNCQSCGYKTCREMAIAISNGYARIQDCVHFMNDD